MIKLFMNKKDKEVIIQFSGGIDSLYVAYYLAKEYKRIHLLTFNKGYLHFGFNFSKPNIENLKKILGEDKVVYKLINMKPLFKEMAVKGFFKNSKKYGNETAWCIPCRASMAIMSIIYALKNDIYLFTDGSNQEQAPEQENLLVTADNYTGYLKMVKQLANQFAVEFFSPVYNLNTREERRNLLLELGFKIDWNSLDIENPKALKNIFKKKFYKRYQPICLSGWMLHWKRNLFNKKEKTEEKMVIELFKNKIELIGKQYIKSSIKKNKININKRIETFINNYNYKGPFEL